MDYINLGILIVSIITLFISIWAIRVAKDTEKKQRELSEQQNKPDGRIKASSIERGSGIVLRLENVGTGIMIVDDVSYSYTIPGETRICDHLSSYFYGIDCKTKTEAALEDNHLLPNSNHNLYKSSFKSQEDLLKAWEIVKNIKIKVTYHGIGVEQETLESEFEKDYEVFMAAMYDPKSPDKRRKLEVFK